LAKLEEKNALERDTMVQEAIDKMNYLKKYVPNIKEHTGD